MGQRTVQLGGDDFSDIVGFAAFVLIVPGRSQGIKRTRKSLYLPIDKIGRLKSPQC